MQTSMQPRTHSVQHTHRGEVVEGGVVAPEARAHVLNVHHHWRLWVVMTTVVWARKGGKGASARRMFARREGRSKRVVV
jgi:hypothetical protein